MSLVVPGEVRDALAAGRPVVALESTILTHGLPRPRNLDVAVDAEQRLRKAGAVPATVGVIDGAAVVGLTEEQVVRLTREDVAKLSVRDLPVAVAKGLSGGTTVAATALLAERAGIAVFATGGIGGVHGGAGFDESADLVTLAGVPITVVSAGVKSILDIPATLERLESLSIPVVGFRTDRFPAFYIADSGHALDHCVDSPREAAAVAAARHRLGLRSAVLIANPVPRSQQLPVELHERVVSEAWRAAREQRIAGKDTTPFLLDHIARATDGRSIEVNIAVYRNNIAVGAEIAAEIAAGSGAG
ncbi:pseudouridine-5'-phosphate glycosidase [Allosalinactinospora lopnorensis]|uniref:pseudouridine-5'-phosphate glycosidase n=1 Tax=Allosalinactinospora lopnorensis TaxID=1352348 RepID=UPI000623EF08|nr:pseudouridine-5'-phosphate glycosidase [Allosalinactinospora lopnorensis]